MSEQQTNRKYRLCACSVMTSNVNTFTFSQRAKRLLTLDGYIFQHNKTYKSKKSDDTVVYWQCERRRDVGCQSVLTTDVDGSSWRRIRSSVSAANQRWNRLFSADEDMFDRKTWTQQLHSNQRRMESNAGQIESRGIWAKWRLEMTADTYSQPRKQKKIILSLLCTDWTSC